MDINWLAVDINEWANQVFPDRTDASMFLKLYKEIGEMIDADDHEDEIADVLIMILDYAKRKGVNPSVAIQNKMRINRAREWAIMPSGIMQHVKKSAG